MNLANYLKSATKMAGQMSSFRKRAHSLKITGESGAGLVRVTLAGSGDCVRVEIDPSLASDLPMLEDLFVAAHNHARVNRHKMLQEIFQDEFPLEGPLPSELR